MTPSRFVVGLLAPLSTIIASSQALTAAPSEPITLDAYVARVLEGPSGRSIDARAAEGAALVEGAGLWPNPALSAERQSGPITDQPRGSQDVALIEVPLVFPGRLSAEHDAAAARGDAAAHERRAGLARLRRDATAMFIDVVRVERRSSALAEARERFAPIVEAARKRADAGESAGGDKLRLEVELARLEDDVRAARSDASAAHRRAEALAGVPLPAFVADAAPRPAAGVSNPTQRADLAALASRASAAELDESAASLRLIPDVVLAGGPSFLNTGSPDSGVGYAVSLRVALPLFDRGQGEAAKARADKARVDAERTERAAVYDAELDVARRTAQDRRERAASFARDVVPRVDALFASTSKAVEVGGDASAVLALVDATRTLRETRLALVDLESASALADADLLFTSGAWDVPKKETP